MISKMDREPTSVARLTSPSAARMCVVRTRVRARLGDETALEGSENSRSESR